ncbi:MAG: site-2 protease family protein, partial [Clostridia bacterium]|nr:site-2 protease family protein [Clostridia bacterium]
LFIEAVVTHISAIDGSILQMSIATFFEYAATISIFLGVLNLLPIPMFDGWHILEGFLPNGSKAKEWVWRNQRTLYIVIIVLLFTGILSYPVSALSQFVIRFFAWLSALPFGG